MVESSHATPAMVPEVLDLIAVHAAQRPNAVAIRHVRAGRPPDEITWAGLLEQANRAQRALLREAPHDRFLPAYVGKSIRKVAVLAGAIASGRAYAGISPKFRLPQLLHVLGACRASIALVDSSGLPVLRDGIAEAAERLRATQWWWLDPPATSAMTRNAADAVSRSLQLLHQSLNAGMPTNIFQSMMVFNR